MKVYKEIISLYDFVPWAGAMETYKKIIAAGKAAEFVDQLEQVFAGDEISDTDINDMLWFYPKKCYDLVGLDKDGNKRVRKMKMRMKTKNK